MKEVKAQSSDSSYRSRLMIVGGTSGGNYLPPMDSASTGGTGGGGNGLETRVGQLETHVAHIQKDIGEIKTDTRDIRNYGLTLIFTIFAAILTVYLYANNKAEGLTDKFNTLQLDVTKQVSNIQADVSTVRLQNEAIIKDMSSLNDSIGKLVESKLNHDKP